MPPDKALDYFHAAIRWLNQKNGGEQEEEPLGEAAAGMVAAVKKAKQNKVGVVYD